MSAPSITYRTQLGRGTWDPHPDAPVQPACRDHPLGPDAWFPGPGKLPPASLAAVAVCHTCPLQRSCRDWARDQMPAGIWGGESDGDRRRW